MRPPRSNPAYKQRCTSTWMGLRCRIWWDWGGHKIHRWWNEWHRVEWGHGVADDFFREKPSDPFPMHEGGKR